MYIRPVIFGLPVANLLWYENNPHIEYFIPVRTDYNILDKFKGAILADNMDISANTAKNLQLGRNFGAAAKGYMGNTFSILAEVKELVCRLGKSGLEGRKTILVADLDKWLRKKSWWSTKLEVTMIQWDISESQFYTACGYVTFTKNKVQWSKFVPKADYFTPITDLCTAKTSFILC